MGTLRPQTDSFEVYRSRQWEKVEAILREPTTGAMVIAVLQLLQGEGTSAKRLSHQERATFLDTRNATYKLEL
jgi:hypothetical protein